MMRHLRLLLLLVALPLASAPAQALEPKDAQAYVDELGTQALAIVTDGNLKKEQKRKKLEGIFTSHVDIDWIGKFVLGRFWRTATPEQKKTYLTAYNDFLTQHYAGRFAEYTGGSFKVTGSRAGDTAGEFFVSMELKSTDGTTVLLDYRLHNDGGKLKVIDVVVEGVSLITTQRSEFSAVLNAGGLDSLIQKLKNKSLDTKIDDAPKS